MIYYVRIFVVDPVVEFFLSFFCFFFLYKMFLVVVCLIFEGLLLLFYCFLIDLDINVLILFRLWVILNDM